MTAPFRPFRDWSLPDLIRPRVRAPVIDWIEANIDLTLDKACRANGLARVKPHQRAPLECFGRAGVVEKLSCCGPEQTGKSAIPRWGQIWKAANDPVPMITVYESDDKSEKVNGETIRPLMEGVPELRRLLELPRAMTADRYRLEANWYFGGAGAPITSQSFCVAVADEVEEWRATTEKQPVHNLRNLDKRLRTYRGLSLRVSVCTPQTENGPAWTAFLEGSRGYWHLRCLGCGGLTIRSADAHLVTDTADGLRLRCPACRHEHVESDAEAMNAAGDYVHSRPEETAHRSYQWGALAAPWSISWREIADARADMIAGRDRAAAVYYWNSIAGLPVISSGATADHIAALRGHCAPAPKGDDLANVFFSADTQKRGFYWIVRGIDAAENTYLLANGYAHTFEALAEAYDRKYCGLLPVQGIIDEGGNRSRDVQQWAQARAGMFTYKGNSRVTEPIKYDKKRCAWRIIANPRTFQADLLWAIHDRENREGGRYWFLPENVPEEYAAHILAVRPADHLRGGNDYENWTNETRADHYFDAEKMMCVLLEFAAENLAPNHWRAPMPFHEKRRRRLPTPPKMEL